MKTAKRYILLIILLLLSILFFSKFVLGDDDVFVKGSIVMKENRDSVEIKDVDTGKYIKKKFGKKIDIVAASPKGDYFVFYYENEPLDGYIFDIKRDSISFFGLKSNSNIWSKNGEHVVYTYANRIDIIPTENIDKFLKKKTVPVLTIKSINEISTLTFITWLDNNKVLFYDSSGEKIKFFVYVILNRKKHFIYECVFNQDGCKKNQLKDYDYIINRANSFLKKRNPL